MISLNTKSIYTLLLPFLLMFWLPSFSQQKSSSLKELFAGYQKSQYDTNRVRLLLALDSFYLYKMPDTEIVLDSALLMARQAEDLSEVLRFECGRQDAIFLVANSYAEKREMASAVSVMNTTKGSLKVRLLIMLAERYLYTPGELKQNLDTAYIYAVWANKLSESLQVPALVYKSLSLLGKYYFITGSFQQGRKCFIRMIQDCQRTRDIKNEAYWWEELGTYMPDTDSTYNDKVNSFTYAERLYQKTKSYAEIPYLLENIGFIHSYHNNIDLAIPKYLESLNMRRSLGQSNLFNLYRQLSKIYQAKGDNQQMLYYALAAVNNMDSLGDKFISGTVYYQLAEAYKTLGENDNSIKWYRVALEQLASERDRYIYPICGKLVNAMLQNGDAEKALYFLQDFEGRNPPPRLEDHEIIAAATGDCLVALKHFGKAEEYYKQMIRLDEQQLEHSKNIGATSPGLENTITGSQAYYTIGKFYVIWNRYVLARQYLLKALSFKSIFAPSLPLQKDIHLMMFKVDSAAGNYLSAINHFEIHKQLTDSILNEAKSKQIQQLNIQFNTAEKEKDLKVLQSKEQLQQKELQRSNQAQKFIIVLMLFLIVTIGIGYSRYRLKQKNNVQLKAQQKEINIQNEELITMNHVQKRLLEEKEWLIKEIHHRVKNNLQMIISLLNTQSEFLDHPSALTAIRESRERMQVIALIHQKLYQPDRGTLIDMNSYIHEMVSYLQSGFTDAQKIKFSLDIKNISMDMSQSVPLGLILNEAITNIVKYAFNDKQTGKVIIQLTDLNQNELLLKVSDNGKGLPEDFVLSESNSIGIQLIKLFAEQLEGHLEIRSKNGVEITLIFKRSTQQITHLHSFT